MMTGTVELRKSERCVNGDENDVSALIRAGAIDNRLGDVGDYEPKLVAANNVFASL